jgi:hypothetical protein
VTEERNVASVDCLEAGENSLERRCKIWKHCFETSGCTRFVVRVEKKREKNSMQDTKYTKGSESHKEQQHERTFPTNRKEQRKDRIKKEE